MSWEKYCIVSYVRSYLFLISEIDSNEVVLFWCPSITQVSNPVALTTPEIWRIINAAKMSEENEWQIKIKKAGVQNIFHSERPNLALHNPTDIELCSSGLK